MMGRPQKGDAVMRRSQVWDVLEDGLAICDELLDDLRDRRARRLVRELRTSLQALAGPSSYPHLRRAA